MGTFHFVFDFFETNETKVSVEVSFWRGQSVLASGADEIYRIVRVPPPLSGLVRMYKGGRKGGAAVRNGDSIDF